MTGQLIHIPQGIKVLKDFHFDYATIIVRDDNVVQINSGDNAFYTMTETMAVHNKINELTDCKPQLILHVPGEFATVDSDTRKFMASENGLRYVIAQAIVVKSMAQRILANFLVKVDKPAKPTKFFYSTEEAEKWLGIFRK